MSDFVPTMELDLDAVVEHALPVTTLRDLDAAILADRILASRQPLPALAELAEEMGAPPGDCLASPLSARATLLAAERGRAFYQHELRARVPIAPELHPEIEVGNTAPEWVGGAYVEPKYFSFRQDAPFAAHNPGHRNKWRPHELLHGAVGFFWHPRMTRFEAYVATRLNELLPVAHWYGFDEAYRARCRKHQSGALYREWCADCERSARPYWEGDLAAMREDAAGHIARGAEHLVEELTLCREEIETGELRPNRRGTLDASSDAIGYVRAHWPRLDAASFRQWREFFLRPGVDYYDDLRGYADRVESVADRLLGGVIAVEPARFRARRQRRAMQDFGYRVLLAMEWLELDTAAGQRAQDALLDALEDCAAHCDALMTADDEDAPAEAAVEALFAVVDEHDEAFPPEVHDALRAAGLHWTPAGREPEWEIGNLAEGISDAMPLTADVLDAEILDEFRDSDEVRSHGRLATRFAEFMARRGSEATDLARLEGWADADPRVDEFAERFAMMPDDFDDIAPAELRTNATLRFGTFTAETIRQVLGETVDGEVTLGGAYWRGQFHVVFVDDVLREVLADVESGRIAQRTDALAELIESGLVVYLPIGQRIFEAGA